MKVQSRQAIRRYVGAGKQLRDIWTGPVRAGDRITAQRREKAWTAFKLALTAAEAAIKDEDL